MITQRTFDEILNRAQVRFEEWMARYQQGWLEGRDEYMGLPFGEETQGSDGEDWGQPVEYSAGQEGYTAGVTQGQPETQEG